MSVAQKLAVLFYQADSPATAAEAVQVISRTVTANRKRTSLPLILVFPELFLHGYPRSTAQDLRQVAEYVNGASFQAISSIAKSQHAAIVYGYVEKTAGSTHLYNSLAFVGDDGKLLYNARKVHLYGDVEDHHFKRGEVLPSPFVFHGRKLVLLVCFDIEMPEAVRHVALSGAELVIAAAANTDPFICRKLVPTRAYENMLFVAYCNLCAPFAGHPRPFCGESVVAAPNGDILAQAPSYPDSHPDTLTLVELDFARPEDQKHRSSNNYFRTRLPNVYTALSADD
jgi:predicted amidohydrolase